MAESKENSDVELKELIKSRSTPRKLDLSNLSLKQFPAAYPLTIHQLHLKNNCLEQIPGCIFSDLLNLVWLDLRNNSIESLPTEIGNAPNLRDLLLGGNRLRELPVELSQVVSLRGIQIQPNPHLVVPPDDILQKGFKEIMRYLAGLCDNLSLDGNLASRVDSMTIGDAASITSEYTQSYQSRILPISLKNPMTVEQYQRAMEQHLRAEERPVNKIQWEEMTEEDKLDLEIENTRIDREVQRRNDEKELENFRHRHIQIKPPQAGAASEIKSILNFEQNRREQAARDKQQEYTCGEVGILPTKSTKRDPTLQNATVTTTKRVLPTPK